MRRFAVPALSLALLSACMAEPVDRQRTNNPEFGVSRLFDHDGCTVYRFEDNGRKHYFVKCQSGNVRTMGSQSVPCGKSLCKRPVEISTVTTGAAQ